MQQARQVRRATAGPWGAPGAAGGIHFDSVSFLGRSGGHPEGPPGKSWEIPGPILSQFLIDF